MSLANPTNREELKQYILTRLGAPVLQINISDEQLDVAITDAFAYYFGRSHYNGTERVYLGTRIEQRSWMALAPRRLFLLNKQQTQGLC